MHAPEMTGAGGEYLWLFTKSPSLEGVIYRVSNRIVRVLELCDGSRGRPEIEDSVFGRDRNRAALDAMWLQLASLDLITDVWFPAGSRIGTL